MVVCFGGRDGVVPGGVLVFARVRLVGRLTSHHPDDRDNAHMRYFILHAHKLIDPRTDA